MQKIIPKSKLSSLLESWMKNYGVVAPTKDKGVSHFRKINSTKEIYYNFLTEVTAKSHFIPEGEKLLEFDKGEIKEVTGKIPKTIVFAMRKCDLNAVQILDEVMFDKNYLNKRKNTYLVGLFCDKPDKFCFYNSMELEDYYDIFLYPKGNNYIIDVKTKKEKKLVKNLLKAKKEIFTFQPVSSTKCSFK